MNTKIVILILLIVLSLGGWTFYGIQSLLAKRTTDAEVARAFPADSYSVFMTADRLTLYALKPETGETAEKFRGYDVLGKTEIDTKEHRMDLKAAFITEMAGAKSAACFNPRHALRSETRDGAAAVDVLISFECGKFVVFYGNEKREGSVAAENLEKPFDQILKNAKVEIAK